MYNTKGLVFGVLSAVVGILALIIPMYVALMPHGYNLVEVPISIFKALDSNAPVYDVTHSLCIVLLITDIGAVTICIIGAITAANLNERARTFAIIGSSLLLVVTFAGMIIGFAAPASYKYGGVAYGEIAFGLSLGCSIPFMKFANE